MNIQGIINKFYITDIDSSIFIKDSKLHYNLKDYEF